MAIITVDTIIDFLHGAVSEKKIMPPALWIEAASKLNVLLGDETDKLYDMQQRIARVKTTMLEEDDKKNVSAVRLKVEATDEYTSMRKQEAKIKRVEEFIRIAKIQARLKDSEMRLQ